MAQPVRDEQVRELDLLPDGGSAPLSIVPTESTTDEEIIRRLALDRLRDLHDDGLAGDYIGRMYGVSDGRIRKLERALRRGG